MCGQMPLANVFVSLWYNSAMRVYRNDLWLQGMFEALNRRPGCNSGLSPDTRDGF
jgi:hypothetical protein